MNKKYLRRATIIAASCLVLISAFFIIRELIDNKQVVDSTINDTTPPKKLPDWKIEYERKAQTEPAERVVTEYGDFYYAPFPKQFSRDEVANLDIEEEVTKDTNQVIVKGYFYEKK
ncbi:hypothetical protein J14TS5_50060 [Paenibacillus lautus]|uniref:hypothetical protein n=1 Tax=Paenibacillus lautus TaxID=1401 RepID=UPI001B299FA1|nr:hypothetical protein [Paenibacillus lautus]GIO99920.1 hypothetical protein J14TS5_50060 [Paenibacillus lautus]